MRCIARITSPGKSFEAAPLLVPILDKLDRWRNLRGVERLLPEYSSASIRDSVRQLIASTAVLVRGSAQSKRESALSAWQTWGVEARFFHLASKNLHNAPITIDEAQFNRALKRREPPPPPVKRYPAQPRINLSDPGSHLRGQLPEVLLSRRTHRRFGTDRVSLEQLSILLRLTWGFTGQIHWPGLGIMPVKTSPSGGGSSFA